MGMCQLAADNSSSSPSSSVRSRTTRSSKARVRLSIYALLSSTSLIQLPYSSSQKRTHSSSSNSSGPSDYMLQILWATATVCSVPSPTSFSAHLHITSDYAKRYVTGSPLTSHATNPSWRMSAVLIPTYAACDNRVRPRFSLYP